MIKCDTAETIKGSIASRTLFNKYGYNYTTCYDENGKSFKRTKVYLEFNNVWSYDKKRGKRVKFLGDTLSKMNGYYYLDDCCRDNNVIDFYYLYGSQCPFNNAGRIIDIKCWVVN